jgi:hypothetical protein
MMNKNERRTPEPIPPPPYDVDELFPEEPMASPAESVFEPPPQETASAPSFAGTNADRGALTQLLTAAQQCGLVINADAIIEVRDRELRAGRYQKAFDTIERIYAQVTAQIARRQEELRRQDIQYRSGALKMSPKQWMLLQRRETEKTQRIERARRHFARVLDGLTVLRAAHPE